MRSVLFVLLVLAAAPGAAIVDWLDDEEMVEWLGDSELVPGVHDVYREVEAVHGVVDGWQECADDFSRCLLGPDLDAFFSGGTGERSCHAPGSLAQGWRGWLDDTLGELTGAVSPGLRLLRSQRDCATARLATLIDTGRMIALGGGAIALAFVGAGLFLGRLNARWLWSACGGIAIIALSGTAVEDFVSLRGEGSGILAQLGADSSSRVFSNHVFRSGSVPAPEF